MPQDIITPCCTKGLCSDPSNPFANLSAEGPDFDYFIGSYHGSLQQPPPLDWAWGTPGCLSFCTSTVSQADADLCAQRQQVQCTTQNCDDPPCGGNGGDGGWFGPGRLANPPVFTNTDQSCTANCPDGLPFTYTLPHGSIAGINQAYCNQQAQSLACDRAQTNMMCLTDIKNTATVGTPYVDFIAVNGGVAPYDLMIISGSVPPGITATVGARFITLAGTPTTGGTFSFVVTCNDSSGLFMQKTYTITVTGCDATTDWVNNPGNCRLRVKNFNPADWAICGTCNASGLPQWDGTFSELTITPGVRTVYGVSASFSIGGAQNLGPGFSRVELTVGAGWDIGIACNGAPPAFMWQSAQFNVVSPLMSYAKTGGCTGPATITLEAYSL